MDSLTEKGTSQTSEDKTDHSQGVDYFNTLPDELITMIFGYMPHENSARQLVRCGMVCRRWQRISLDESLWMGLNIACENISLLTLSRFIQRGVRCLNLHETKIKDLDPWVPCFRGNYESRLEVLRMNLTEISQRGLGQLLKPCRNLVRLEMVSADLSEQVCEAIGRNSNLKYLDLSGARGLDASGLTAVLTGCQNIEELQLNQTSLSLEALSVMALNLSPSLKSLNLRECSNHLHDLHVFELVDRCRNLRSLNLSFNHQLTQAAFEKARTLEHLDELVDMQITFSDYDDDGDDDDYDDDDDVLSNFSFPDDEPCEIDDYDSPEIDSDEDFPIIDGGEDFDFDHVADDSELSHDDIEVPHGDIEP